MKNRQLETARIADAARLQQIAAADLGPISATARRRPDIHDPMMKTLAGVLVLSVAAHAGCQLIKVNGKPLGGGSPSSASSSSSPSSPSSSSTTSGAAKPSDAPAAAPAAAQAPMTPGKPAEWCEGAGYRPGKSTRTVADYEAMKTTEDSPEHTAGQYAWVMCATNKVPDFDKIMSMRAKWLQAHGWDEGDFVYLAATANRYVYRNQDVRDFTSLLQIGNGMLSTQLVELDALGTQATMFSRFFALKNCFADGYGANTLLRKIMCTREQLDPGKAYAEIDKVADINRGTRFQLRKLVREAAASADKARAEVGAKAKEDPAIAKVIAIADEQFKNWGSPSPSRAKLVKQLEGLEAAARANKNSAFVGCDVTTRASWEEHLQSVTIPKVATEDVLNVFIRATLETAEGYLAYQALRLCAASDGTATTLNDFMGDDLIQRGPRTGTMVAWIAAANDIKFDDRSLNNLWEQISKSYLTSSQNKGYRHQKPIQGVIASIKEEGGNVAISFKTVVEKREDCVKWHEGTQIVQRRLDGSPIYRRDCVKWGMVDMDLTADSIRISKVLAHGLKPGMFLVGVEGFGIAATANPKSAKAAWVFGGAVK